MTRRAALLAVVLAGCAHLGAQEVAFYVDPTQVGYVALWGVDVAGQPVVGSGVWVGKRTILTAGHVATQAASLHLREDRSDPPLRKIRIGPLDMAILEADVDAPRVMSVGASPRVLDRVLIVGTPLGAANVAILGTVSAVSEGPEYDTFLIDSKVFPGMSGAAVISLEPGSEGRIVGMVFRSWGDTGERMGIAIGGHTIRRYLVGIE